MLTQETQVVLNADGELEEICVKCAVEALSERWSLPACDNEDWDLPTAQELAERQVEPCRFCNFDGPPDGEAWSGGFADNH